MSLISKIKERFLLNDIYNLDYNLAKHILPRLKLFKKNLTDHPACLTMEQWKKIVDKMIIAFELVIERLEGKKYSEKVEKSIYQGLWYFSKYFLYLYV